MLQEVACNGNRQAFSSDQRSIANVPDTFFMRYLNFLIHLRFEKPRTAVLGPHATRGLGDYELKIDTQLDDKHRTAWQIRGSTLRW
jgi:hypothetical protein